MEPGKFQLEDFSLGDQKVKLPKFDVNFALRLFIRLDNILLYNRLFLYKMLLDLALLMVDRLYNNLNLILIMDIQLMEFNSFPLVEVFIVFVVD